MRLGGHGSVKGREKMNRPLNHSQQDAGRRYHLLSYGLMLLMIAVGAFLLLESGQQQEVVNLLPETTPTMVKRIALFGEMEQVDTTAVERLVREFAQHGMLALDLMQLRAALEALPWVYRVKVRKLWPETVEIWLQEQHAVVAWGEDGYLNGDGEFFEAAGVTFPDRRLPRILSSRRDTVAIHDQLNRFSRILGSSGYRIERMVVDRRGAVTLHMESGLELALGRRALEQRLLRWRRQSVVIMSRLNREMRKMDLRYEQGMAIGAR